MRSSKTPIRTVACVVGLGLMFVQAALAAYRNPDHGSRLVQNGMAADFSWQTQGKLYELVYNRLTSS